ncbi:hypothetical protein F2Q69_00035385 [Brassica cretica]|uniref:Uncharacterized protein n=1 Tax=Brassica cretica TaxID=69181 RepID=A0A8S9SQE4_BRACR|nr:hypothetical protein F2Q69_00035385 [Brassica cretica]
MNNKQGKETCRLELPLGPNQAKEITNSGWNKVSKTAGLKRIGLGIGLICLILLVCNICSGLVFSVLRSALLSCVASFLTLPFNRSNLQGYNLDVSEVLNRAAGAASQDFSAGTLASSSALALVIPFASISSSHIRGLHTVVDDITSKRVQININFSYKQSMENAFKITTTLLAIQQLQNQQEPMYHIEASLLKTEKFIYIRRDTKV